MPARAPSKIVQLNDNFEEIVWQRELSKTDLHGMEMGFSQWLKDVLG